MGARPFLGPVTAPAVNVVNKQTGPIEFDVTADIQAGSMEGWMIRKQDESKFGNIRFYSKEGAAEAGNLELAPQLILEFGGQSASAGHNSNQSVAGLGNYYLEAITHPSERPTIKRVLQENATVAYAVEVMISAALKKNPLGQIAARTAYRSWLNESLTLASISKAVS